MYAYYDMPFIVLCLEDALVQTSQTLKGHGRTMPSFGVVQNLVEEEVQYAFV